MDDTPTSYIAEPTPGTCVLCPDEERARVPHQPPVCDACRSWLAGLLGDIRILHEQLSQPEPVVRDERVGTFFRRIWSGKFGWIDRTWEGWRDPVAHSQPAGPIPGVNPEPRVSGSHGAPIPANLGRVDLTLRAWPGSVGPHTRGVLGTDEEQVGDLPLATALESWVQEWRHHRARGEGSPEPTVDAMTRWLQNRVEDACDEYPEVASFADDMRRYRSALRRVLGVSERPEYKVGVACPKCQRRTLYRANGESWVRCGSCPAMLSLDEYAAHAGDEVATLDTPPVAA